MKNNINGILLLDKPLHLTSNAALQRVKRIFSAKKAGHTGNLDPLATGMLPICFGEATKFSQFLLGSDKHYRVTIRLGIKTTTGDAEGEIISQCAADHITQQQLEKVMQNFLGEVVQVPPMFSAIKHQGVPLYELARKGLEVERKSRTIIIYKLLLNWFRESSFSLDVHCSKGTYIRTLAEDIGEKLGCGAYVTELSRTAVAPYEQSAMHDLSLLEETLKQNGPDALMNFVLPIETALKHFPAVTLSTSAAFYLQTGQSVRIPHSPRNGFVRLQMHDEFLGVGEILPDTRVAPRRLLSQKKFLPKAIGGAQ